MVMCSIVVWVTMMRDDWMKVIHDVWRLQPPWLCCLRPLSWLYRKLSCRFFLASRCVDAAQSNCQTWLVCNLLLGGTGKSPFVAALCRWAILDHGLDCAIVVGGYRSQVHGLHVVQSGDRATWVGDEAKMLYESTGGLVVVCRDRAKAVAHIHKHHPQVQLILLDDGLQNARTFFHRTLLMEKKNHNQHILPQGPFRNVYEDIAHLIDVRVGVHDDSMYEAGRNYHPIERHIVGFRDATQHVYDANHFSGQIVHAVAGIGSPQQFFDALTALGMTVIPHTYANHGMPPPALFTWDDGLPVITTHKDAVKLSTIPSHVYVAQLDIQLSESLRQVLASWL